MTTRKKYSREFKLDAIHLLRKQGYTGVEAARYLDVNANSLDNRAWGARSRRFAAMAT